ncbi:MAG TPA: hypothetical protein VGX25_24210 [Actinophytocola sp.]|uniref:hypothetical protein n=1 Tax=Actinophytocola sp. TaxID=1872138 RepID=UPI002DDCBDEB|nr:hypothetical protein [Actinophytocola sp.]HEV2782509.1 hypothetical protein [Actinophytocola sp.]
MSATELTRVSEPAERAADTEPVARPTFLDRIRSEWTVRRVGGVLAPAIIYLGIRELSLLVLTWMSAVTDVSMVDKLRSWDGWWFYYIAAAGYGNVPSTLRDANGDYSSATPMAFFPGYPTAARWLAGIDGPGGIGVLTAAFTVTIVSGVLCAYGLARLGRQIRGGSRRVGLVLVALFAASPMAIVLSMAYSEAMFCALAVWSLVGVLERRWVLAGVCCGLAGLVRPTAAALVLAVGLAVLVAVVTRRDGWRPWVGGVLAPVGLIGYLAWVGAQLGAWNAWFTVQQNGWNSGFDGGVATWDFAVEVLTGVRREAYEFATIGLIIVALVLAVICVVRRVEWPLLVYGIGVLTMDLASSGLMNSKIRLMVPAFTLLIPIAINLAKRRTSTMVLTLCGLAVASAWFGAYAITAWSYAI